MDQHVQVDRGLVLQVIETAEAEALVAIYEEIEQLLDQEDPVWLASFEQPQEDPAWLASFEQPQTRSSGAAEEQGD